MSDPHLSSTLKHRLAEWTDFDFAAYYVAVALGVAPDTGSNRDYKKWVYWSANPLGDGLYQVLKTLAGIGVLEEDQEMRFRWNPTYNWEKYGTGDTNA